MQWFRMYGEFLTDPLVRLLSFEDQRHFIGALCMKCLGVLDKEYATEDVRRQVLSSLLGLSASAASASISAFDQANERLRTLGLVDEHWQPLNWEKRQFPSDHSDPTGAERQRRYRDRQKTVTPVTRDVTALEQSRTEQKENRTECDTVTPGLDPLAWKTWLTYRKSIGKPIKPASIPAAQRKLSGYGTSQAEVVEQSVANGWQGLFELKTLNSGAGNIGRSAPNTRFSRAMEALNRG